MDGQDWNPIRVQGTKATIFKSVKTAPKNTSPDVANQRRLEQQTEVQKPKTLSTETRTQMMQVRAAMKKTQVELNQLCGFPANTVRDIEAGKYTPTSSQLIRLNNVLKVKFALS